MWLAVPSLTVWWLATLLPGPASLIPSQATPRENDFDIRGVAPGEFDRVDTGTDLDGEFDEEADL